MLYRGKLMITFFHNLASVIYQLLSGFNLTTKKTMQNLILLHPTESHHDLKRNHNILKIRIVIIIIAMGIFTSLLVWITNQDKNNLVDGSVIYRNDAGKGSKEIVLTAEGSGQKAKISLTVTDRAYSHEELEELYRDFENEIEGIVLDKNTSWNNVDTDLNMVEKVYGYPFEITWESSQYLYLNDNGQIIDWEELKNHSQEIIQVNLLMKVSYDSFYSEKLFEVTVCPRPEEQSFEEIIHMIADEVEKNTRKETIVKLPGEIEGKKVIWTEKSENKSISIIILSLMSAMAVWVMKDHQVTKLMLKKRLLLNQEYQTVISKMTLYLGAGMNLNSTWMKVAREGKGNPVYQEMLLTCREMEGGIPDRDAYERFAQRIRQQEYVRLITFLVQSLQKGNTELLVLLKQESIHAMEDYHALVKRRGEEMGTKLLFPMIMMLGMVMVLIIIPVFLSM